MYDVRHGTVVSPLYIWFLLSGKVFERMQGAAQQDMEVTLRAMEIYGDSMGRVSETYGTKYRRVRRE